MADDRKGGSNNLGEGATIRGVVTPAGIVTDVPQRPTTRSEQSLIDVAASEAEELIANGLDRYDVERRIGVGGMGEVFLGRHRTIEKPVAIKVLSVMHRHNPELVERFLQEAKAASAIRHENVVDINDFGDTPHGSVYFVMEFLEGIELARLIEQEQRLAWPRAKRLILQVLAGLGAAHDKGILHRDMKAENCFVLTRSDGTEQIKVLDFGIAKIERPGGSGLTKTGVVMGTADYMSPEQAQGHALDRRTDVYSVGIMLFFMLTGRLPFTGNSSIEVLSKHLTAPPPRMSDIPGAGHFAERLEQLVAKCLAKNPDDRFSTMSELAEAVSDIADDAWRPNTEMVQPAMVAATPEPEPSAGGGGSRSLIWVGAAAAGLVLVGGGAWWAMSGGSGNDDGEAKAAAVAVAGDEGDPEDGGGAEVAPPPPPPCPDGMVLIQGGPSFMGSDDDHPALRSANPQHKVDVKPYCMDIHEVTVEEYRECSSEGRCLRAYRDSTYGQGSKSKAEYDEVRALYAEFCNEAYEDRPNHPINCVTWDQAKTYCEMRDKRLPTEEEWEFAARGSDGRVYPWGDDPPSSEHANACGLECKAWLEAHDQKAWAVMYEQDDGFAGTAPIGSFQKGKTEHGLLDMVGNVFEWTATEMKPYPGAEAPAEEDAEPEFVVRGGAFNSPIPQFAYPSLRYGMHPEWHSHGVGFRCAATPAADAAGAADTDG